MLDRVLNMKCVDHPHKGGDTEDRAENPRKGVDAGDLERQPQKFKMTPCAKAERVNLNKGEDRQGQNKERADKAAGERDKQRA